VVEQNENKQKPDTMYNSNRVCAYAVTLLHKVSQLLIAQLLKKKKRSKESMTQNPVLPIRSFVLSERSTRQQTGQTLQEKKQKCCQKLM